MMSEHRIDHAGWENIFANIPIHHDAAVEFGDLGVEGDLGPLRDDPTGRAESLGDIATEQLSESESTGEHDRGQHLRTAVAGQISQYRKAGVSGVRGGGPHGVLYGVCPRCRVGRAGQVDVEQQRRGEITDQTFHIGVQRLTTEQRHVQQEARGARPVRQGVREGRGEHHGRCHPVRARVGEQRVPGFWVQPLPAPSTVTRQCLSICRRQRGRVREFGEPVRPPVPVGVVSRPRLSFPAHDLVAVLLIAEVQFRQLPTLVQLRQVGHQGAVAHRVGCLHVQIDVQARLVAGQQREGQLEYLPVELLVRLGIPKAEEPFTDDVFSEVAKVVDGDAENRPGRRIDLLGAVGEKLHPQHRMPQCQRGGRLRANVRDRLRRRRIRHTSGRPRRPAVDCRDGPPTSRAAWGQAEKRLRHRGPSAPRVCRARKASSPTSRDHASMVGSADSVAKSTSIPRRRHLPASDIILIESRPWPMRLPAGSTTSALTPSNSATSARTSFGLPAMEAPTRPVNSRPSYWLVEASLNCWSL